MINIDPKYVNAYLLKSNVLVAQIGELVDAVNGHEKIRTNLNAAVECLRQGIAKADTEANKAKLDTEWEHVDAFARYYVADKPIGSQSPDPNFIPLKIISKQKPSYTDRARRNGVQGSVQVLALFGADGKVASVIKITSLDPGLDANSINAAYKIKFEPAQKDGKPISVVKVIEFGFSIY